VVERVDVLDGGLLEDGAGQIAYHLVDGYRHPPVGFHGEAARLHACPVNLTGAALDRLAALQFLSCDA
jgi:hypothetical protein